MKSSKVQIYTRLLATFILFAGSGALAQTVGGTGLIADPDIMRASTGRSSCSFEARIPTGGGEITMNGVSTVVGDGGGPTGGKGTFTSGKFTLSLNNPGITCDFHLDTSKPDNKYIFNSQGVGFQTLNWVADSPACKVGGLLANLATYRDQHRLQMSFKKISAPPNPVIVDIKRVSMLRYFDSSNSDPITGDHDPVMSGECW